MRACDEMTYDAEADALHLGLACEWSARSDNVQTFASPDASVLVDVVEGQVVGIEVLGASRKPQFSLVTLSGDMGHKPVTFTTRGHHAPSPSEESGE